MPLICFSWFLFTHDHLNTIPPCHPKNATTLRKWPVPPTMGQVSSKGFNSKHRRPKKSKRFTPKERVEPAWPISQAQRCIRGKNVWKSFGWMDLPKESRTKRQRCARWCIYIYIYRDLFLEWKKSNCTHSIIMGCSTNLPQDIRI